MGPWVKLLLRMLACHIGVLVQAPVTGLLIWLLANGPGKEI